MKARPVHWEFVLRYFHTYFILGRRRQKYSALCSLIPFKILFFLIWLRLLVLSISTVCWRYYPGLPWWSTALNNHNLLEDLSSTTSSSFKYGWRQSTSVANTYSLVRGTNWTISLRMWLFASSSSPSVECHPESWIQLGVDLSDDIGDKCTTIGLHSRSNQQSKFGCLFYSMPEDCLQI